MLCVTGGEHRTADLARRLRAHQDCPLQEVRLDLLEDLDEQVYPLLAMPGILVACRPVAQGGGFRGSEAERLAVLRRALAQQPGLLDLELTVPRSEWDSLLRARGRTRLVCSHHLPGPGVADLRAVAEALAAVPAQVHKLAVAVEDTADLLPLLELDVRTGRNGRPGPEPLPPAPLIRIGMGPAGLVSRALPAHFGSPWTYVHADRAPATAPGQLSVSQARAWRIDDSARLRPLLLLGGEQVLRSPGALVYNRLFRARTLPFVYLPAITRRPAETLLLLERLGGAGASVTMPLKEAVMPLLEGLHPSAARVGAVNTVRLAGGRQGFNSDAAAVAALAGPGAGRQALVLGAGGAARAAVAALDEAGWAVTVCGRNAERAGRLASRFGAAVMPWEERGASRHELVVNATPCGSQNDEDPIPGRRSWEGATLIDLVLRPQEATPLVRRAATAGARVISGLGFWLEQGARQMSWLLDEDITVDELRGCLDD